MDAVTIFQIASAAASTAQAAWDVGEGLYRFCRDVRVIDQTVHDMVAEVKALASACDLIDVRLRHIVKDLDADHHGQRPDRHKLWTCVKAQVIDSRQSVLQLDAALKGIKKENSNKLAQAWRQIKLNMKTRDIAEARNRIRSHTAALQTVLQTVAIEICYLAPQRADQELRPLLGSIQDSLEELKALIKRRDQASPTDAEETVVQIGEAVAFEGESLYAASVANGSLWGDSTTTEQNAKVHDWMKDIQAIDKLVSQSTHRNVHVASPQESLRDKTTAHEGHSEIGVAVDEADRSNPIRRHDVDSNDESHDLDSDDEFAVEIAQEAFVAARESFDAKIYIEAAKYLQESLKMVRQLPAHQQGICNTFELMYMLSVCTYHIGPTSEAESHLLSVLNTMSTTQRRTNDQLLQICTAGDLLSKIYLRLGKLDQARLYCENALQGRRRLLGRTNSETCDSIGLMAMILKSQGNAARANVYLRLVPETSRQAAEEFLESLGPLPSNEQAALAKGIVAASADLAGQIEDNIGTSSHRPVGMDEDIVPGVVAAYNKAIDLETEYGTVSIAIFSHSLVPHNQFFHKESQVVEVTREMIERAKNEWIDQVAAIESGAFESIRFREFGHTWLCVSLERWILVLDSARRLHLRADWEHNGLLSPALHRVIRGHPFAAAIACRLHRTPGGPVEQVAVRRVTIRAMTHKELVQRAWEEARIVLRQNA